MGGAVCRHSIKTLPVAITSRMQSVCVSMATDAHSASSSVSDGHAWKPLPTCGAGGCLQRGQLGVELPAVSSAVSEAIRS